MKIKGIVAFILAVTTGMSLSGCNASDKEMANTLSKQKFALEYFKALAVDENTVVSPLLALTTIGELSGITNETELNKCLHLLANGDNKSKFNIDCGRIIKKTCTNKSDNTGYNEYTTSRTSGFLYSSNFVISQSNQYNETGFDSVFSSNLNNLYLGKISAYSTSEQYDNIAKEICDTGGFGNISEWHEYGETDLSLFNSLDYCNSLVKDYMEFSPCEVRDSGELDWLISDNIRYCGKTDYTMSCSVYTGDVSISLLLIMPTESDMDLDTYIENLDPNEFSAIINNCMYEPWCKDSTSVKECCVFPEIENSRLFSDINLYDLWGLGNLVHGELELTEPHEDVKMNNTVQKVSIEFRATSDSVADYNEDTTMVFDRPFVYALIENESGYPVIIGRSDNI